MYFSSEVFELFGYDKKDFFGITFDKWRGVIHPDDRGEYFRRLNSHLKGDAENFTFEYRVRTHDGLWKWVMDSAKIISFDSLNSPQVISGVISEISSIKEVEMELLKAQKKAQKNALFHQRLLNLLSTDIREPFNAIIGLSEILSLYNDDLKVEQREALKSISYNSKTAFELVGEIIEWSRLEESSIEIHKNKIVLRDFLKQLLSDFSKKISIKGVEIRVVTDNYMNFVSDPYYVGKILSVFIDNAIKYSYRGGNIVISWEKKRRHIFIIIEDNGIGVSNEAQKSLFDVENTIVSEGTEGEQGYGISLVIAKKIADNLLGGDLKYHHSSGKGSVFTLEIPIQYF
ncbi:MAG: HAMP domain-containing sensor histidine kinase [Bacteroidota bacterium]|nr:HAMP domain-containing sensor histidine kinase [Bacteroidota bacterium]